MFSGGNAKKYAFYTKYFCSMPKWILTYHFLQISEERGRNILSLCHMVIHCFVRTPGIFYCYIIIHLYVIKAIYSWSLGNTVSVRSRTQTNCHASQSEAIITGHFFLAYYISCEIFTVINGNEKSFLF